MRVGIFTEVYKPYVSGVVTSILMLKKSFIINILYMYSKNKIQNTHQ